jgi:diguanylate cyclase (GGDEF)-like protein/PAS domain S-box-containing protein
MMKDKDTPKEQLKRLKRSPGERGKELQCFYGIARIVEKPGLTLDEIYQEVLELLPRSWQYPEVACAQLTIDGKEFKTANYRETEWKQSTDIKVHGMKAGMLVVGYLEDRPASDEGPFLKEERLLIDAIAERLGRITERKQTEGALRESEERYRTLVESAAEGILIANSETRKLQYANSAFCTMLGYSQEELTKMSVSDIHPKTSLEQVFADFAAQARGEKILSSALPCLKKDGTIVYADIKAAKAIIDGRECNIGFFTDVTERKQAEDKIEQAQETLVILNNKLEERGRQNSLLSEMRELLQSCSTVQEMPTIVISYVAKVLPGTDGALFLLSNSRTDLQSVARWGDFPEDADNNIFAPDACWGLRRGRVYAVEDMKIGPICPHLKQPSSTAYICLPLIGRGETLGLLHLGTKRSVQEDDRQWNIAELKDTAIMFAQYLSLSIANIKLSEKLASQSIRDTLTGLFNRRYMEETIQREILRAARKQTKIGIVMADIDHFKQINDTYGHEAGDEFLMKLADFFKTKTRGSDIACRYGGEEFILILPESSVEDTYKRADYLREEIKKMKVYFRGQLLPSITLSFGIATYPDHGIDTDELMRVADTALYKAKEEGRDRVIVG